MVKLKISHHDYAQLCNVKRNICYKIIAVRESRGISYSQLELMLNNKLNIYGYSADYIRKSIEAEKLEENLCNALCKVLDIYPDDEKNIGSVIAYRYLKERVPKRGKPSKQEIEGNKQRYEDIKKDLEKEGGFSEESIIMDSYTQTYSYNGIECDWDIYVEFMEEDLKKDILKKILAIYDIFPQAIEQFLEVFEFEKEDLKQLDNIDIEIKYK